MALNFKNQLKVVAGNLLTEVNDALTDVRDSTLPQARVEVEAFLDELETNADEVLAIVQTAVVDLKAKVQYVASN